jgi:hypothetical protein
MQKCDDAKLSTFSGFSKNALYQINTIGMTHSKRQIAQIGKNKSIKEASLHDRGENFHFGSRLKNSAKKGNFVQDLDRKLNHKKDLMLGYKIMNRHIDSESTIAISYTKMGNSGINVNSALTASNSQEI